MQRGENSLIAWGVAGSALRGGVSGDRSVVAPFPGGILLGVIDGLGHGPEAAAASIEAELQLRAHAGEPVEKLIETCHARLRGTRGAVISLASLDASSSKLECVGVGNVEGILYPASAGRRESILLRGGIVGFQVPRLRTSNMRVGAGDVFIMATDGVRTNFADDVDVHQSPEDIAETILARHARGSDDALVLVTKFLGSPS